MYSLGGGEKPRVHLDARVNYVTPGTMIDADRPWLRVPILTLQYDLPTLGPVSAVLGAMHIRKEEPDVYVWQEANPEPEVAVVFRSKNPDKAVLDDVAGKIGATLNEAVVQLGCEQVFTLAEVNLNKATVETLIREFDVYRILVVDIREVGLPFTEAPVRRFVTRNLHRREYKLEI